MVRQAKKAAKGDDAFKTKKQKVGRKKLAPATATRAEVHARTLRINNSINMELDPVDDDTVIPQKSFAESLVSANHYRENVRRGALVSISNHVIQQARRLSPVHRLQAMTTSLNALTDTDSMVRDRAVAALQGILKFSEINDQTLLAVLQHAHIALTHAVGGVKKAGVEVISSLLKIWPGSIKGLKDKDASVCLIVERVSEVVLAGSQMPQLSILACLLEEVLDRSELSSSTSLASSMAQYLDDAGSVLLVKWKELMELNYALFRDAPSTERCCAIARILTSLGVFLKVVGTLSKSHCKLLKEVFILRVPFSMQDLCGGEKSAEVARLIASGCVPILSSCEDAYRTLNVFLSSGMASSKVSLDMSLSLIQQVLELFPGLLCRVASLIPPLMHTVTRSLSNLTSKSLCDCADVVALYFVDSVELSPEATQHIATAIMTLPRILFAVRRLSPSEGLGPCEKLLTIVWKAVASRHPVLHYIDAALFTETLQSIFGLTAADGSVVPGILDHVNHPRLWMLGTNIFYYLRSVPQSIHCALPFGINELPC